MRRIIAIFLIFFVVFIFCKPKINTEEVVKNINSVLKNINSYKVAMSMEVKGGEESMRLDGTGWFDDGRRRGKVLMEFKDKGLKSESYFIGDEVYVKTELPGAPPVWVKMPSYIEWGEVSELRRRGKLLKVDNIESIRIGEVDGEECYIIKLKSPGYEEMMKEVPRI